MLRVGPMPIEDAIGKIEYNNTDMLTIGAAKVPVINKEITEILGKADQQ